GLAGDGWLPVAARRGVLRVVPAGCRFAHRHSSLGRRRTAGGSVDGRSCLSSRNLWHHVPCDTPRLPAHYRVARPEAPSGRADLPHPREVFLLLGTTPARRQAAGPEGLTRATTRRPGRDGPERRAHGRPHDERQEEAP